MDGGDLSALQDQEMTNERTNDDEKISKVQCADGGAAERTCIHLPGCLDEQNNRCIIRRDEFADVTIQLTYK